MSVGTLFDGSNDHITSTTGNDITYGGMTVGGLIYHNAFGANQVYLIISNGGVPSLSFFYDSTVPGPAIYNGSGFSGAVSDLGYTGWTLFFITKASGTSTPRLHHYNGTTWVHTNFATALADPSGTLDQVRIGLSNDGSAPFNGDIGTIGLWGEDSNDAAIESYLNYTTLAAKSNARFFTGTSLQNGATMNDTGSGNNDETTRAGATVGRYQLPNWFTNFDATPAPEFMTIGARTTAGTTSCAIAVPTGIVAGNMLLVGSVGKPSTATTTNPPSSGGFSAIDNTTGGGGTQGTDTGPQRLATAYKDAAGGEGTLTYTWASSPNSVTGLMARYEKVSGGTWVTPVAVTADDSSAGTSFSATSGGTLALAPGDTVAAIFGGSTDATTAYTAAGFTSTGITFSTPVLRANAGGAGTGQDIGQMWTEAQVISGTGTSAVTVTLTGGPTSSGPVHIIRLRATVGGDESVDAGTGTSTGTSNNGSAKVAPNGGTATSTGTGNQPAASVKPNAGQASASGVANNPTITASSNVPGGTATATGVANDATTSSTGEGTNAPAGHAAASGAADTASTSIKADAGDAGITYVEELGFVADTVADTFTLIENLGDVAAGSTIVIVGALDNAGTSGAATTVAVADFLGNTYTVQSPQAIADPGAANEGVQGFIAVGKITTAMSAGVDDFLLLSFGNTVTAKAISAHLLTGADTSNPVLASSYARQDNQTGQSVSVAAGTNPTAPGQLVFAIVAVEGDTGDTFTQDTDTTGGAWQTLTRRSAGSGTSGVTLNAAYKIVTAAGTQTYDHATMLGTSRDHCAAILVLESPGAAWGTGTANNATVSTQSNVSVNAGHAAATGTADTTSVKISPNAGTATAAGVANDATVSTTTATNAPAGHATGTGTADTGSTKVSPNAGTATATGVASDATASASEDGTGNAGHATGTGVANNSSTKVSPNAGTASATGVANNATVSTTASPNAGHASATGVAFDATVQTSAAGSANAGQAAATGEAQQPAASIKPNAGTATATGTANNATTTSDQNKSVAAGHAAATGVANQPSTKVTFNAGTATAAGVAERPVPAIMPAAGTATATSSVGAAAVAIYVTAAIALATGEAFDGAGPNTPDAIMLEYIVRRARPRLVALNRPDVVRRQRP